MIRRINYTGRQRIKREHVSIVVHKNARGPDRFDAKVDLEEYNLPKEASVSVEAYRRTGWMRFSFGTVGLALSSEACELTEFDSPDGVLFRVKVTSGAPASGKLLAEADQIPFHFFGEQEERRAPLLAVAPADLGFEITKIDLTDRPLLLINSSLGDWRTVAKLPVFISLIYPHVLRQILTRILTVEKYREVEDVEDAEDWKAQWLLYATRLPGVSLPPDEADPSEYDDWIDDAVKAFAKSHGMIEQFRTPIGRGSSHSAHQKTQ